MPSEEASQRFPEIPLVILQYRPAWLEQLVLRIAGIPHVVVNSTYASHESTGPLPALRDLHTTVSTHSSLADAAAPTTTTTIPILVGRRQPRIRMGKGEESDTNKGTVLVGGVLSSYPAAMTQENSILEYLKQQKGVDIDAHLKSSSGKDDDSFKSKQTLSKLLSLLITIKLHKCLMVLRYEDRNAWDQIYRMQCLHSSKGKSQSSTDSSTKNTPKNLSSRLPTMRGLYQAWSERVMARKALRVGNGSKEVSVDEAKAEARKAYEILEQQLTQIERGRYLVGTEQPAMVDALLWDHLAEALCDVNLVLVLADFPKLIQFFQRIYDAYFVDMSNTAAQTVSWSMWNKHQNYKNHFQQIPLEADMIKEKYDAKKIKHALELMQTLSVRDHDLLEVLKVGRETRSREWTTAKASATKASSPVAAAGETKKEPETALEKARRQQQRHDQYWISLVAGVAILGGLSTLARMTTDEG